MIVFSFDLIKFETCLQMALEARILDLRLCTSLNSLLNRVSSRIISMKLLFVSAYEKSIFAFSASNFSFYFLSLMLSDRECAYLTSCS